MSSQKVKHMSKGIVKVNIERYDPEKNKIYSKAYEVPRGSRVRVLDFLNYIFEELDPSLGYRRHLCKAKLCKGCVMTVNGNPRMACWEIVSPEQNEITISALKGKRVLKDQVVDFENKE